MALVEVKVPDIGDFKDVEVIEVLVKPGDTITVDQSLLTVESDKASMEIPSTHAGVVKEIKAKLGDKVNQGTLVLMVEAAGAEVAAAPAPTPITAAPVAAAAAALPAATAGTAATAATAATATLSARIEVLVPDIGDFAEVTVIEVFVKPGDSVKLEQSLITVESDKASMEIPSSHAGVVDRLLVKVGDKVAKGSPLVVLQGAAAPAGAGAGAGAAPPVAAAAPESASAAAVTTPAAAPATAPATAAAPAAAAPATTAVAVAAHQPGTPLAALPHASPSIRRLARELGVPLAEVLGSGPKGRITQTDVQGFVKGVMAGQIATAAQTIAQQAKAPAASGAGGEAFPGLLAWPKVDFAKFGPVERKDLSRIKKISGANLHRNWVLIPHVTNHDDADITELESFRVQLNKENEKSGVKVTMLAFLIKACVAALKKFPEFNASLEGEQLVMKGYFHVGFAADTPSGLVVPVIKDADKKGILQISKEMSELAAKAREGKLGPADMSGGCFSISSLGGIGGRYFTPIINAPEVAILGVCKSSIEAVWDANFEGGSFQPRLMLPLSLSWDHRVIDGATAARFNAYLGQILGDFRRVLL